MRYYTYVSQSKVDMLFGQIQSRPRSEERTVGFDTKIFKLGRTDKLGGELSLYHKVEVIEGHLKAADEVGDIYSDKPYIAGKLLMRMGGYGFFWDGNESPIAFWGYGREYASDKTLFAMAGSRHHLIGHQASSRASSHSLTDAMTAWFLENLGEFSVDEKKSTFERLDHTDRMLGKQLTAYDVANGAYLAATQMGGTDQLYQFLAKVLHRSTWPDEGGFRYSGISRIVLGSPIYVSLAE